MNWSRIIFDHGLTQLLHADLHWLDVPECIKYKLCMMVRRCQDGTAPQYLAVHWSPVFETASWQHLHSAASRQLTVPPHMVIGRLLLLVRRRGTHCQNIYMIPLLVLLFFCYLSVLLSSENVPLLKCTSVSSALEALAMMRLRYINLRFTLHYIIVIMHERKYTCVTSLVN